MNNPPGKRVNGHCFRLGEGQRFPRGGVWAKTQESHMNKWRRNVLERRKLGKIS